MAKGHIKSNFSAERGANARCKARITSTFLVLEWSINSAITINGQPSSAARVRMFFEIEWGIWRWAPLSGPKVRAVS
jgi:hypothetical protein